MTLTPQQCQALNETLDGDVSVDEAVRAMYATDASVYQIMPAAVARPRSVDDVSRMLSFCRDHGVPITARGGGTSQAGQAIGAGVQLDFSRHLNQLLELQPDRQRVRVQPGIVLDELNSLLKPYGLVLPLDLSTSSRATIGGMVSNNSSGTRSVIYGKTIDYVESVTVMLSDGSIATLNAESSAEGGSLHARCQQAVLDTASEHAQEIVARYPNILRRVGGYNLDAFVPGATARPNLAHIIVGAEGTLALLLEVTLRVVPVPAHRTLVSLQFDDLLEALAVVPRLLEHQPSAIELVDRMILSHTTGKSEFEPLRWFIEGDPAGVLLVELQGDDLNDITRRLHALRDEVVELHPVTHTYLAESPEEQSRIWTLRKAALGLTMAKPGDDKAISFVEDTAVDPAKLRDYIARFRDILARHDTTAGFYAHASVGLLHIRPVVNLKTQSGQEVFASIASEVADLVLEFGGALSGEHGDGLVRAPFQERMFGPTLYQAFRDIKQAFDPDGLLNPGKIVDAPDLGTDLRFTPAHRTPDINTTFDFSDFGGIARAAEQCSGVGACRKSLSGTMCPSYMATRNESDSTRGRANALRMAINGQLGPEGLAHRSLKPALDLCLECKACKSECPTGVDMARLKSEFLDQFHARHPRSRSDHRLAHVRRLLELGSGWPRLVNWLGRTTIASRLAGMAPERQPPQMARIPLLTTTNRMDLAAPATADVVFFPDTFSLFCEPQHVLSAMDVARRLGLTTALGPHVCCGRPLVSKGFLNEAQQQATQLVTALLPIAMARRPIVFLEPSCWSAAVDDLPRLVPDDLAESAGVVAAACQTFEEWVAAALAAQPPSSPIDSAQVVLHHGHCHQKALSGTAPAITAISKFGHEPRDLDGGCCGMAGSFGYTPEHYQVSINIGERVLGPAVRNHNGPVIAPGFSCRHQIQHLSGITPLTTAQWISQALQASSPD